MGSGPVVVSEADHGVRLDAWLHRLPPSDADPKPAAPPGPAAPPANTPEAAAAPSAGDGAAASQAQPAEALSRRAARTLCDLGAIAVDGVLAHPEQRLRHGQTVQFAREHFARSLQLGLAVRCDAEFALVLHKPAGLAVHGGPLVDTSVADVLARHLPGAGLAQRLDREASGLLLVGPTRAALAALGAAMEQGRIARTYLAVVHGEPDFEHRTVDLKLRVTDEPRGDRPKTVVDPNGQPSVSHVTVVDRRRGAALVRVRLETGRTHQIRAHLQAIGHPLLGDPRYGDPAANERARGTFGIQRTLLHCSELRLPRPDGGELVVTDWHPEEFARLFPRLRRG